MIPLVQRAYTFARQAGKFWPKISPNPPNETQIYVDFSLKLKRVVFPFLVFDRSGEMNEIGLA